jgi:5-methyltetrahydropteroyltriglutamate--homocysteine methyltransferase
MPAAGAFRAEVIGSLLRPAFLKEARQRHASGAIGDAELKRVEDRAVDDAVRLQTRAGVSVVTDGEMRRYAYFGHFIDSIEGFDKFGGWAIPFRDDQGNELLFQRAVVVGHLRRRRHLCAEEFTYLRARTDRPTKATLISALNTTSYWDPDKSAGAYPTREAYLSDAVDILRGEVDELVRLGCTYIQMDGPPYTLLLDPATREGFRRRGTDPERLVDLGIEMDNAVIGHHPGVTFALHLCRGNNQSKYIGSGGYDPIAARIFRASRFQRFLLEYDDARSGGFGPLRNVPDDRTVVLGLVTTKRAALESPSELQRRIREAAAFVPLERLALSPQCGFASTQEGNLLSEADQAAKLALVTETARGVWGES